ncbi:MULTISPECIES: PDDEXK family nuclease [Caproicibacterium]|uniref:VRR-NUC domain-containing protein n=1 Tax=Caproicibacterium argilliputei TaxID=3030016 RepID=A0AA97DC79_9FIRM|nr:VRR-NUC domain-containing protein [Caproicibacterium argilliputei]WOC33037.1 VRR-NUC domain-containing protein [Caproicibacterium argilliputei]
MQESSIERYLTQRVKALGGRAYKFVSPGNAGVPDRLVCFPGGHACFVELKAPGKKPRPLQVAAQEQLRRLGFAVETIDCKEQVDGFLDYIRYQWGVPE